MVMVLAVIMVVILVTIVACLIATKYYYYYYLQLTNSKAPGECEAFALARAPLGGILPYSLGQDASLQSIDCCG
jgi:hypothetical protein